MKSKQLARRSLKKIKRNAQITDIDINFRNNTYCCSLLLLSYSGLLVVGLAFGAKATYQPYNFFSE